MKCVAPLQAPPDDLRHRSSEDQPITLEWFAVLVVLEMDSGRSFSECENQRNDVVDFCLCFFEDCCSCNDFIVVFHITGITKIPCSVLVSYGSEVPHASSFTCLWFLKLSMWKPGAAKPNSWRVQTDNREDDWTNFGNFSQTSLINGAWGCFITTHLFICFVLHMWNHMLLISTSDVYQHPITNRPEDLALDFIKFAIMLPKAKTHLADAPPLRWPERHVCFAVKRWGKKNGKHKSHWKRRTKNCLHFEPHHDFQVRSFLRQASIILCSICQWEDLWSQSPSRIWETW